MNLERILRIIKNRMTYTICEHEKAVLEFRICGKYSKKPEEALKCYKEMQKPPQFIKLKNRAYLKCPLSPIQH